jgi:gamma-glutamyltranspeptidase/glutathione hydrolase
MSAAIELAKNGYLLGSRQAQSLAWNWAILGRMPEFRRRFGQAAGEGPKTEGQRVTRPRLANTLEGIAKDGGRHFYAGPVAKSIALGLEKSAAWTEADLGNYRAKWRDPLTFSYGSFDLATMPPPSSGGVALMGTLLLFEKQEGHRSKRESARRLHLFVEAATRAHAERRFHVVDPDTLSDTERAARRRRWQDAEHLTRNAPVREGRATPAAEVHEHYETAQREAEHTTHFSVVDETGNAVSCTITLSGAYGSRIFVDQHGVILNNAVASFGTVGDNLPAGGRRTLSSMAPTLVFQRERLELVLGSPGGDTIPNTIAQVFLNVVDYGLTIDRAADLPRIHHGFVPDEIRYERARPISKETRAGLERMGHRFSKKTIPIGDANVILLADGNAYAYADRREGGLALAAKAATGATGKTSKPERP